MQPQTSLHQLRLLDSRGVRVFSSYLLSFFSFVSCSFSFDSNPPNSPSPVSRFLRHDLNWAMILDDSLFHISHLFNFIIFSHWSFLINTETQITSMTCIAGVSLSIKVKFFEPTFSWINFPSEEQWLENASPLPVGANMSM